MDDNNPLNAAGLDGMTGMMKQQMINFLPQVRRLLLSGSLPSLMPANER